jgi:Secretion system C-terminal sorting domain
MNQLKIFLVLLFPLFAVAQSSPQPHIIYSYDDAGNRIQRKMILIDIVIGQEPDKPTSHFRLSGSNSEMASSSVDNTQEVESGEVIKPQKTNTTPIMSVFPNPTTGIFNLELSETIRNAEVSVYDENGQTLFKKQCQGSNEQMDISNLPSGSYRISVSCGEWYGLSTIIKQ